MSHLPITKHVRLEVMPTGQLAMEVGDLDAVVIFTPSHARRVATRMRTLLCGDDLSDLLAERRRIDDAIAYKRRQRMARPETHRPTRSEQSLEGTAVNGLMPVGQEAASE